MIRRFLLPFLLLASSSFAATPTRVQYVAWGTNNGGKVAKTWQNMSLPHPTQANNLLVCGASWDTTSVTLTITDDGSGNTWTAGPTSNDGTRVIAIRYVAGVSANTQKLTFTLSTAEFNVHFFCSEWANVATSSPSDGSCSTSNITGPTLNCGSFTTTVDGDLILYYSIDDASLGATNAISSWTVGSSFTLLGANGLFGHAEQYQVQTTHGAINPSMTAAQTTHDTFGTAAIAFKAAAAGTVPTGARIVAEIVFTPPNTGTSSTTVVQFPCTTGDTLVATGSTQPAQYDLTSITDSDSNSWTRHSSTGNPQILDAQNVTCTSPNSRTVTIHFTDHGSPDPVVMYDMTGMATASYDSTMGVVLSGAQTQTDFATSSTACSNVANSNSSVNATPSTANGIMIVVENNGQGPECGMSSANNTFDAAWFQSEDDACCGMLNSASGYGHIIYSSATSQTATFNWANALAGSGAPGSSYAIAITAYKAAAAAPGVSPVNKRTKIDKLESGQ